MEVAVEHDRRRAAGLLVGPLEHGREGVRVAVQAADDIEGAGLQLSRLGKGLRLVPVGQRAGPAARIHALPPWRCPDLHAWTTMDAGLGNREASGHMSSSHV